MLKLVTALVLGCLVGANCRTGFCDDIQRPIQVAQNRQQPATKGAAPVTPKTEKPSQTTGGVPARAPVDEKRADDEAAIRKSAETYLVAFNQGNAKSIAEHYTDDAEYVDEQGRGVQGRATIEETMKELFTRNPDAKMMLKIDSIRFVGPGVAVEDGSTSVILSKDAEPIVNCYTAVHLKHNGKWLTASARDIAVAKPRQHREQLKPLEWMLGEWVHEGTDAVVDFSCKAADNGNSLIRSFTIRIAHQEAMSGSQRICWDAQARKLRSWVFDSDGGHSDGFWHRDGDSWVLKSSGVTADGQSASSTSIYSRIDDHTMTFQSVDHEIAGVEFPDSPKVKIVRRPPRPE